jgi:sugar phosphate isomerase/epimerase
MSTLGSHDLVASWWTLAGAAPGEPSPRGLAERVVAAAQAGFGGIGLRHDDLTMARREGLSDAALRRLLQDNGIEVFEIEFISGWSSDDAAVREQARRVEDGLYALAAALGARPNLNAGCSEPLAAPVASERAGERFAALCDRAASEGLAIALEFMPWTAVPDAASAWELIDATGRANAGVLVDSWHYFRGAAEPSQLRGIPAQRISGLQIDDAAAEVIGTLREDTLRRRLLPGDGSFDLVEWVRLLDRMGVALPYAVEVISDQQSALPLATAARRASEATRAVLAKARMGRTVET